MKKLIPLPLALLAALVSLAFLTACNTAKPITGTARNVVLSYSEPKTDNLLQGYNAGNYTTFARDFDETMLSAETETVFTQTRANLMTKLGAYQSRQITDVITQDNFVVVIYSAKFDQADNVTVRVVFQPDGDHPISGLWFNSPKLN